MTKVIRPDLEKRKPGKNFNLLDEKNNRKGVQNLGTVLIEPGGIVQLRYRGRRVGARITKAAANEFVGQILSFEASKPKFEDLTLKDFIAFREENIFGYDPPAKSQLPLASFPSQKISTVFGLPYFFTSIVYDSGREKRKISGWFLGRKNANWIKEDLGAEGPFFNSGADLGPKKRGVIFYNPSFLLGNAGGVDGIRTRGLRRDRPAL